MDARTRKRIRAFMVSLSRPWEAPAGKPPAGIMEGVATQGRSRVCFAARGDVWLPSSRQKAARIDGVIFAQRDARGMWRAVIVSDHLEPPAALRDMAGGPGWLATSWRKTRRSAFGFMEKRGVRWTG